MFGWTKFYADGTKYEGSDLHVKAKVASWRNSKSNEMVAACIEHGGFCMRINGLGDYWQSDKYEVDYPRNNAVLLRRRIEKRIDVNDKYFRLLKKDNLMCITFNGQPDGGRHYPVPAKWRNKWLILEYDLKLKEARYYISDNQI